jgi:acyl-coenzyme A thioesterase 13
MSSSDIKHGRDPKFFRPDFSLSAEDRVRTLATAFIEHADKEVWGGRLMRECCKLVSANAETATVVYEIAIEHFLCNVGKTLHGGAAATILDHLTSTALFTIPKPGYLDSGMFSRTLTVTYLRPVPMGMKAIVEAEVVSASKTLANVRGVIKTPDGKPCVTCVHDLALGSGPKL